MHNCRNVHLHDIVHVRTCTCTHLYNVHVLENKNDHSTNKVAGMEGVHYTILYITCTVHAHVILCLLHCTSTILFGDCLAAFWSSSSVATHFSLSFSVSARISSSLCTPTLLHVGWEQEIYSIYTQDAVKTFPSTLLYRNSWNFWTSSESMCMNFKYSNEMGWENVCTP